MQVEWKTTETEEISVKCPICDHQTAPPEYPYCEHCEHTLFVYLDPYADDSKFDFMREYFASEWEHLGDDVNEPDEITLKSIKLDISCVVFDITESLGHYPTRIIVGFDSKK